MSNKLTVILIGALALILVVGTGYLLLRPTETVGATALERDRGGEDGLGGEGRFASRGSGREAGEYGADCCDDGDCFASQGVGRAGARGDGAFEGGPGFSGQGGGRYGAEGGPDGTYGEPLADHEEADWETVMGEVIEIDSEMLIRTDDGEEILVGLGQSIYRESLGFEIEVVGFYEDGEFKAGTVNNLTTGETLELRDATGRPFWAGRGNGQNRR